MISSCKYRALTLQIKPQTFGCSHLVAINMFILDSMHGDTILYGEQSRIASQYFVFLHLKTFYFFRGRKTQLTYLLKEAWQLLWSTRHLCWCRKTHRETPSLTEVKEEEKKIVRAKCGPFMHDGEQRERLSGASAQPTSGRPQLRMQVLSSWWQPIKSWGRSPCGLRGRRTWAKPRLARERGWYCEVDRIGFHKRGALVGWPISTLERECVLTKCRTESSGAFSLSRAKTSKPAFQPKSALLRLWSNVCMIWFQRTIHEAPGTRVRSHTFLNRTTSSLVTNLE